MIASMDLSLIQIGWEMHLSRGTLLENDCNHELVINSNREIMGNAFSRGTLLENDCNHEIVINSNREIMGNAFESWDIAGK